jgi:mercuric ion transport protein
LRNDSRPVNDRKGNTAAAGGVIGAVLASSCCIGPLLLISLGASGAWIGNLTALKAYQPFFIVVTLAFLGIGFWQVYGKSERPCDDEPACTTNKSNRVITSALWIATLLVTVALTADLWAPLFY